MNSLPPLQRVLGPRPFGALLAALVLVSLPLRALAQEGHPRSPSWTTSWSFQQPLATKRCSWARVEKRQVPWAGHELAIQCQLPRDALWGEGASRSLSLRYSDAEEGQQQSLVSVTQTFRASAEYPPVFVPKVEQCAPDTP